MESTTGWRFVVEELERVGAEVHLAEPAEAAALKGKKKRAKTDWTDARHLRELLLIGCCRGRGSRRRTSSTSAFAFGRGICYRTSGPSDSSESTRCSTTTGPAAAQPADVGQPRMARRSRPVGRRPRADHDRAERDRRARSRSAIDVLDLELVPFDQVLRAQARKQPGCRALIKAIYGVGELTAITIVAELGDTRRFHNSRDVVR